VRRERGFVLVEVIVALSLLAILTAAAVASYTSQARQGRDEADKTSLATVAGALESYYGDNADAYPATCDMATLGAYVRRWPLNASGEPMGEGTGAGEYTYTVLDAGQDYTLTLHLRSGGEYVLPAGIKPAPAVSP
jgi:prepilin-type N-terminal cleavage/methylation domain-containing protein